MVLFGTILLCKFKLCPLFNINNLPQTEEIVNNLHKIKSNSLEAFISVGACDCFKKTRTEMLFEVNIINELTKKELQWIQEQNFKLEIDDEVKAEFEINENGIGNGSIDVEDGNTIIDWLIESNVSNPDAIGVSGISYGAGIGYLLTAQNSKIRALVALSGWGDLAESLAPNLTPRMDWVNALNFSAYLPYTST